MHSMSRAMPIFARLCLLLLTLSSWTTALLPNLVFSSSLQDAQSTFNWRDVTPSRDLSYHGCYEGFECARLNVPLDWNDVSNANEISLAIIRLPATVPHTHSMHGGTIFLNPGGPGGSGVQWALQIARKVQALLDGPKHYEILSFDPRGIFRSTPNAYCFDNAIQSEVWSTARRAVGGLNDSEFALKYNWRANEARGYLCAHTENGEFDQDENLRQHLSTAYVATDMLRILEKVEKHKHAQERIQLDQTHSQGRMERVIGEPSSKLQYIGTSYGTLLGQTLAAMYPDRVGRFVLDANVDGDNWVSRHESGIQDHAEARQHFFDRCFASASYCAFYRPYDRSPSDIASRLETLLSVLEDAPVPIVDHGHVSLITKSDILSGFMTTVYQPLTFFATFAEFLNDLVTKQAPLERPFWLNPVPSLETFSDDLLANLYQEDETSPAVHCSDGPDLSSADLPAFQSYLINLTNTYGWAGAIQAQWKLPCWTWPASIRTKWRYAGPFAYPANSTRKGAPILFVNNRVDPVCSVANAKRAAAKFTGSAVLVQDTVGHGALWPAGDCIWGHVKAYFDEGLLPDDGTVCPAPCKAFAPECEKKRSANTRDMMAWWWQ